MARWPLERTPFYFIGPRPYREAEVAAYIRREHRRGRRLAEIVNDPYIDRRGGRSLLQAALGRPSLIRALGQDVCDAIRLQEDELQSTMRAPSGVRTPDNAGETPRPAERTAPESSPRGRAWPTPQSSSAGHARDHDSDT
jgi:hypothetical protein